MVQSIPLLFLALALASCNLLGSNPDNPPPPGRRDYTWRVDTLHSPPGGFIYDIWGSSPNNVWAVAGGGIHPLWHYDGNEWAPWQEQITPGMWSLFGFSRDNAWMGAGNGGKIYHFDGNQWSLSYSYWPEGVYEVLIMSIWGSSPTNIYASGVISYPENKNQGFLLNYNGRSWRELAVIESSVQLLRVRGDGNGIFLQGWNIHSSPTDSVYFYRYSGNRLKEIYANNYSQVGLTTLNLLGNNIYFMIDGTLYRYTGGKFREEVTFTEPRLGYQIYGRYINDVFIRMDDGLMHYNGEDTQYLYYLDNARASINNSAVLFENDVFFVVHDYAAGTNLIYHGRLEK